MIPWDAAALREPLEILWDYVRIVHQPVKADAILALGSFDPAAAVRAAQLWKEGWAPLVVMSGGIAHVGGVLDTGWGRAEAEVFADIAVSQGVPAEVILLESSATNTAQNFTLTRQLLLDRGLVPRHVIAVAKPYMTRRALATAGKAWPDLLVSLQCEQIDVMSYLARDEDPARIVHAMVGDMHRIMVYPALGHQLEQFVPPGVAAALHTLVDAGYSARLVPGFA